MNSPHFNSIDPIDHTDVSNLSKFCNASEPCAICLDSIEVSEAKKRTKQCKHVFHPTCLRNWNRFNPICPTCRRPTSSRVPDIDLPKINEQIQADHQLAMELQCKHNEQLHVLEFDDGTVVYVRQVMKKRKKPIPHDYEEKLIVKIDNFMSINSRLQSYSRNRRQLQRALLEKMEKQSKPENFESEKFENDYIEFRKKIADLFK